MPDCAGLVPLLVSVKNEVGGGPVVDRGRTPGLGQGRRDRVDHHALTGHELVTLVVLVMLAAALEGRRVARTGGVGQARPVGHAGDGDGARGRPLAIVTH